MDELKCVLLSERSQSGKVASILYDSNHVTLQKRQIYGDGERPVVEDGCMGEAQGPFR